VAGEGESEVAIGQARGEQGGPIDQFQGGNGAGDGAGDIGDDDIVIASDRRLGVGTGESGSGCASKVGAVEAPLVAQGHGSGGGDREGGVGALQYGLALRLGGNGRRAAAAGLAADADGVEEPAGI